MILFLVLFLLIAEKPTPTPPVKDSMDLYEEIVTEELQSKESSYSEVSCQVFACFHSHCCSNMHFILKVSCDTNCLLLVFRHQRACFCLVLQFVPNLDLLQIEHCIAVI